ncbi:chromate resistance protein ChrB domain-containing protein [Chitinilyticum litopenaei]|uniref:chromate resistance protein ChrB domain-containing protein n=1 Tax=Chitinilyticum litopenaei TaxID=1121276 RepID=UPI00048A7FCD|nr:chromate resistance protein ChrB domain-containing protein [Chitinilyticum litopenaei]
MNHLLLIVSLPAANATLRQRVWRGVKAAGAAILRDGAYLLPAFAPGRDALAGFADEVSAAGGSAFLLTVDGDAALDGLFARDADYAALIADIAPLRTALSAANPDEAQRQARRLRRQFAALAAIDFFPGAARDECDAALAELELACARALSPDEPGPAGHAIVARGLAEHRGRVWATRRRPWVDRLASAWLIRGFIDPEARFLWLASPADCPEHALGFDFDGATFSHVGALVTFETLLASFGLAEPALQQLARIVHYLDVGGTPPPEAAGIERVLAGLRDAIADDDALLAAASAVFDALYTSFTPGKPQ